jgi:hypothetical protein
MKILAGLIWALCLLNMHADTLRISIDTNWVQPYVVAGNSNETVTRVILDGTLLDRDIDVNDIPLTLTLSNMSYSAFTNCVLWANPYGLETNGQVVIINSRSYPLHADFLSGTNTFHFPWPPRVFRGEQRILYLSCGTSRNATNGYFRWDLAHEYTSVECTFTNGITCTYYTNQIHNYQDGSVTGVEMVQRSTPWIPVITRGVAKLSVTLGEADETGTVRQGHIRGQGRPFRKYTIRESLDLKNWDFQNLYIDVSTGTIRTYVEADATGSFSVPFSNFVRQQRARFYHAYEEFE